MILAVDTSAGTAVSVVTAEGVVLAELSETSTMRHAEVIGDLIRDTLADAGIPATDVTAVASGMGPGPFTGLRIGIAAARAFAFGRGVPVVPVGSHDAIAAEWFAARASADAVPASAATGASPGPLVDLVVVTDARRREVAWSRYTGTDADGVPVRTEGPDLAPAADAPSVGIRLDAAVVPAGELGRLAATAQRTGRTLASGQPLYLRSPDVTMPGPAKRVSG